MLVLQDVNVQTKTNEVMIVDCDENRKGSMMEMPGIRI